MIERRSLKGISSLSKFFLFRRDLGPAWAISEIYSLCPLRWNVQELFSFVSFVASFFFRARPRLGVCMKTRSPPECPRLLTPFFGPGGVDSSFCLPRLSKVACVYFAVFRRPYSVLSAPFSRLTRYWLYLQTFCDLTQSPFFLYPGPLFFLGLSFRQSSFFDVALFSSFFPSSLTTFLL